MDETVEPVAAQGEAADGADAALRRAGRRAPGGGPNPSLPYITRKIREYEVLDEEGLALIEKKRRHDLEEIGIEFREDPEALALWKEAGADVRGERVHFPKGPVPRASEDRAVRIHLARPQPGAQLPDRRQGDRVRPVYALPSCVTSTASAVTPRSRTSAIS